MAKFVKEKKIDKFRMINEITKIAGNKLILIFATGLSEQFLFLHLKPEKD